MSLVASRSRNWSNGEELEFGRKKVEPLSAAQIIDPSVWLRVEFATPHRILCLTGSLTDDPKSFAFCLCCIILFLLVLIT